MDCSGREIVVSGGHYRLLPFRAIIGQSGTTISGMADRFMTRSDVLSISEVFKYWAIAERRLLRMVGCLLRRLGVTMGTLLGMERLWRPV